MLKKLSNKNLEALKSAYESLVDQIQKDKINKAQFQFLFEKLSLEFANAEIQLLFFVIKPDSIGCIDFNEFLNLMRSDFEIDKTRFVNNLFAYLDRDNDGTIDFEEFKKIADIFDDYTGEEELRVYFDEVDNDNDGKITFEEFEKNESIQLMNKFFLKLMNALDVTAKNLFAYMERDNDGLISFDEFKRIADYELTNEDHLILSFNKTDTNQDGKLSLEEFSSILMEDNGIKI